MEWLNYHHLLYFWTVAKEGGVARAAETLRLSQPTVSTQVRALETSLGHDLFTRSGRTLTLTDVGQVVYRYADEIFSLGRELQDSVRERPTGRPSRLVVGVADAVEKLIAYRLLAPALRLEQGVHIICREDTPETLLARLAVHGLDVVIADAPVPPSVRVKAFSHLLGECGVSFFATPALAQRHTGRMPRRLSGAPFLLPSDETMLRRSLEQWFDSTGIRPKVVGEFDDSALMMTFGENGVGVFPAPSAIEREVCKQYGVRVVGRTDAVRERFYAITVERRLKHPAVVAISEGARGDASLSH